MQIRTIDKDIVVILNLIFVLNSYKVILLKIQVPQAFDVFGSQTVAFNSSTSVCAKDVGSTSVIQSK